MNKLTKIISLIAVLVFMSGCSLFALNPAKDGDKIIKDGIKNLMEVKATSFDVKLKGDLKDLSLGNVTFDTSFLGSVDQTIAKSLLLNLKAVGSGSSNEKPENLDGEIRINKDDLYFFVNKLSDFGGIFPEEVTKPLLSQWWKTKVPQSFYDSMSSVSPDELTLTPEEKKANELLKNTQFFSGAKYISEENGAYHYQTALDKEAVKTYKKESAKIGGAELTADELTSLDTGLKNLDLTAEVWVGVTDKTVHKAILMVKFDDKAGSSYNVVLDGTLDNMGKAVTVETPKDAKDFNPGS